MQVEVTGVETSRSRPADGDDQDEWQLILTPVCLVFRGLGYLAPVRRIILALAILVVIILGYFAVHSIVSRPATANQSVGDPCLVGTWILQREQGHYTTSTTQFALSGLSGATLTITGTGAATYDYSVSAMENGRNGTQKEQVIVRGTRHTQIHAVKGALGISTVSNHATQTISLDGTAQPSAPLPDPNPSTAGYGCSKLRLQIDGQSTAGGFTYSDIYNRQP
jgi:hypothetical protein